ncbi:MAG: TRAP transporter large permease, partial [Thermodesulfobacteriota bacterium]
MYEVTVGLVALAVVLLLFLTGIELGFAMALVGFLGFAVLVSTKAALNLLAKDFFDVFASYGFTVIPLFVLMGQIAFNAGIAKRLFNTAYRFIGHVPGGMAMATVAGATAFKAICGSSPATAATFASVAVPEMDRYGYDKKLSTGIVATVGTLGILIPPSVTLIVFGIITELSIGRLFLAGLIPGLIIAFFFIVIIYGWCKINPKLGPKGAKSTWKERFASLPEFLLVVVIFLLMIVGLMKGLFTPTEAGSVGTGLVLLMSILRKDINFKGFIKSVGESLRTACMVLMLIAGSTILGHFLAVTKLPMIAADWVTGLAWNKYVIMILISFIYQTGGSFIDDLAFMILATPIFYPVIIKLGFDPIWFGMIIAITVMIGVVIPPVAINVFVVKNITKVPFNVI